MITLINNALGFLYLIFIITGFKQHPYSRFYRKILENPNIKFINGFISSFLFFYGLIRVIVFNGFDVFLLTPLLFFITLILVDSIYRPIYKRTINLILRFDFEIDDELNIWDKIASVILLIVPMILSFIIGLIFVK